MKLFQLDKTNPYYRNTLKEDLIEWATFVGLHLFIGLLVIFGFLLLAWEVVQDTYWNIIEGFIVKPRGQKDEYS